MFFFAVSTASRLHKKLMYANEHHTCLINSYKKELDLNRQELVKIKATRAKQLDSVMSAEHDKAYKYDSLEKELRMVRDANSSAFVKVSRSQS